MVLGCRVVGMLNGITREVSCARTISGDRHSAKTNSCILCFIVAPPPKGDALGHGRQTASYEGQDSAKGGGFALGSTVERSQNERETRHAAFLFSAWA